jgi:hypothetical protein
MKKPVVLLATAAATLALAGAVGAGVASAEPTPAPTSSPAPTTSATPTAGPGRSATKPDPGATKKKRDLTRRALHGEVTVGAKKARVVVFQRGVVSAVSGSSVSVTSVDGFVGTYAVGPQTKVREAKKEAGIGDVSTGDRVRVVAAKKGQTLTATRIVDRTQ